MAPGCVGPSDSGTERAASRGVSVSGPDDAAGAAGGASVEPSAPGQPSGKLPPAAPDPTGAEGGSSATSGAPSGDESAGAAGAAGASAVTVVPPPACGKEPDGTLCGPNMTPAGADGTRYFCSAGVVVAEARCPGTCNVQTNACVQSGGTGGGTGETGLHIGLRCPGCYASLCRDEQKLCDEDPFCVAHLECIDSCNYESACFAICDRVFEGELLFDKLDQCVEQSGCAAFCPPQGQP